MPCLAPLDIGRFSWFGLFFLLLSPFNSASAETVHLQLHWLHQFEFAGYYAALEQGYYREAGFDVEIHPGGAGQAAVDQVVRGHAEFGVAGSELVLARLRGAPVVALAPVFQHSAATLLVPADSPVREPADLRGLRVEMGTPVEDAETYAMLRAAGVDPSELQRVPSSFGLDRFVTGESDALSAYLTNQPFHLKKRGFAFRQLRPASFGINFYGDTLFTSENYLQLAPERVAAFREASLRGWHYAFAHGDEMIDLILRKYADNRLDREFLVHELEMMEQLVMPRVMQIGHGNPDRWVHMADTFVELGLVKSSGALAGFHPRALKPPFDWAHPYVRAGVALALTLALFSLFLVHFNRRLRAEVEQRWWAEDRLSESERRLSLALSGANLGCWEWRLDLDEIYIDERAARMLGYEPGAGWFSLHDNGDTAEVFRGLAECFTHGNLEEERAVGERWLLVKGKQLTGENIQNRALGTLMDVTQAHAHQDALRQLSITDPLTGLYNRRYFFERLERAWKEPSGEPALLTLALLDIDFFKRVNDRFGHQVGDRMLVAFAHLLKQHCRPYDLVARYGGEEFIVMLSGVDKTQAHSIFQRYQLALAKLRIAASDGEELECRFSCGIADTHEMTDNRFPDDLVRLADQRLYGAKRTGRNRILLEEVG